MLIDKTKFLFLVGALTAVPACSASCTATGTGDDDDDTGSGGTTSSPTTTGQGGDGGQGDGGSGGETGSGGAGSGGETGSGGAAACLDEEGDPDACSGECEACAVDGMIKDGVEEAITACLNGLDGATCDADVLSCVEESLAQACPDETADDDCAYLEKACGLDPIVCHEYLDGLTPEGRDAVTACDEALCDGETSQILDCIAIVVATP